MPPECTSTHTALCAGYKKWDIRWAAPDWSGVKKTRGREASQGDSVPWQSCWDDCRGGTQLRHIYRKRFPESDAQRNDTLHHLIVWLLEGECNTQRDPVNSGTTDVTTAKDQSRLAFFHLHLRKEADATKWSVDEDYTRDVLNAHMVCLLYSTHCE